MNVEIDLSLILLCCSASEGDSLKMNLNWAFGLLIAAVGNLLVPPPPPRNDNVFDCPEEGCTRKFLTANGRRKHFKRVHLGIRKSCQYGCGKTYTSNERA